MMGALHEIISILTGTAKPLPALHMLPAPVQKKPRGEAPKREPGVYDIEVQYNASGNPVSGTFGFRSDKEASREGAVKWLTNYDRSELEARSLGGKTKEVKAQNVTAKERWSLGDSVAECARHMGLSDSWVEKRYACFSTALSSERG